VTRDDDTTYYGGYYDYDVNYGTTDYGTTVTPHLYTDGSHDYLGTTTTTLTTVHTVNTRLRLTHWDYFRYTYFGTLTLLRGLLRCLHYLTLLGWYVGYLRTLTTGTTLPTTRPTYSRVLNTYTYGPVQTLHEDLEGGCTYTPLPGMTGDELW